MNDGDRLRMDWDTGRRSSQTYSGVTGPSVLKESLTILKWVAIGIVALPVLGIGLLYLFCLLAVP